jgi:hypothetical protein
MRKESHAYEGKVSEEVKLTETGESERIGYFSNEKSHRHKAEAKKSYRIDDESWTIKNIIEKLQDSYIRSMELSRRSSEEPQIKYDKIKESNLVQSLYVEFKKFDHKDIFMFIMDTRDELLQSKQKYEKLKYTNSQVETELVMLKKFYNERSPLKHSKERYEKLEKELNIVRKESECLKQYNTSLKKEVESLTKS